MRQLVRGQRHTRFGVPHLALRVLHISGDPVAGGLCIGPVQSQQVLPCRDAAAFDQRRRSPDDRAANRAAQTKGRAAADLSEHGQFGRQGAGRDFGDIDRKHPFPLGKAARLFVHAGDDSAAQGVHSPSRKPQRHRQKKHTNQGSPQKSHSLIP